MRLLARLADELYFTDLQERRERLYEEAVEIARRLGDPATLAAALRSRRLALWGLGKIEARLATTMDIVLLAEEVGDRELTLAAHNYRLIDLLELGDIAAAEAEIEVAARLAQELRHPRYLWFSALSRAMLTLLRGRFDEGERLAQEALALGQQAHEPDALLGFGAQMFLVRRQQGRLDELKAAFESFVEQYPAVPSVRCEIGRASCRERV